MSPGRTSALSNFGSCGFEKGASTYKLSHGGAHAGCDLFNNGRSANSTGREAQMLVLTRKSNQSIMIGDDIEISVLAIMGEKVRIGIEAPRKVPVFRKEVYLEIQQERSGEERQAERERVDDALQKLKTNK
jgi:carbon storage regulator